MQSVNGGHHVDRILEPYTVQGYEPHVARPRRVHVDELPSSRPVIQAVNDEEFWTVD